MLNRGFQPEEIQHYLNPIENDILDPFLLDNMREGVAVLIRHIKAQDRAAVIIDVDCDGCCSSAILINYLHDLFPAWVENCLTYYMNDGKQHGIIYDNVPNNIQLLIVPDAGTNDAEACQQLKEQGIDILILDHHLQDIDNPYACIINNQTCSYPNKSLCGAGIVYKFCSCIDFLLEIQQADQYLDLVALGLIADVMSLQPYETHYLVTKGLSQINNPYFKMMVEKQSYSLKDKITPQGVAFYIAPYINATIRMGTNEDKMLMFEAMLNHKAYELIDSTKRGCKGQKETRVEQACRNCTNVKSRQQKARDAAIEVIEKLIQERHLNNNKILLIQLDSQNIINKNLTGLVANILMSEYGKPVMLLNETYNEQGEKCWEGSARNVGNSKFENFKDFITNSGLCLYGAGHEAAFGAGIEDKNVKTFIEYSNQKLASYDFSACYKVDFIFDASNFNGKDIIKIAELKSLWGQGVEEPYIALENVKVYKDNVFLMSPDKSPTLKILLPNGTSIIKFKSSKEEYEQLKTDLGCLTLNIVGRCEENVWNGSIAPQIIVTDYEVIGIEQYYF